MNVTIFDSENVVTASGETAASVAEGKLNEAAAQKNIELTGETIKFEF